MSDISTACKTLHMLTSPSSREQACESFGLNLSQGGLSTNDQGQMLGAELGLVGMTDVEYAYLQHLIQAHMELQAAATDGPEGRCQPAMVTAKEGSCSTVGSLFQSSQVIDLSASTDEHQMMSEEKTPSSYGEVPGFVFVRLRNEANQTEAPAKISTSSENRCRSVARVCLEKRFNSMSPDALKQQDIPSTVLSNLLTKLQQSAEGQEAGKRPQKQKWMNTDWRSVFETSSSHAGVFNPVTNMCGQVIGLLPHVTEPNTHQSLITKCSCNLCLETAKDETATPVASKKQKAHTTKTMKAAKVASGSAGKSGKSSRKRAQSYVSLSQRREKHNNKERERRRRIRLFCDELNTLVPFCQSDTDKATTLHWTAAFLKYINTMYGDTFKEEFKMYTIKMTQ